MTPARRGRLIAALGLVAAGAGWAPPAGARAPARPAAAPLGALHQLRRIGLALRAPLGYQRQGERFAPPGGGRGLAVAVRDGAAAPAALAHRTLVEAGATDLAAPRTVDAPAGALLVVGRLRAAGRPLAVVLIVLPLGDRRALLSCVGPPPEAEALAATCAAVAATVTPIGAR